MVLDDLRVHSAGVESFRLLGGTAAAVASLGAAGNEDAAANRGDQKQEGNCLSHIV
jgi:hypothetical protein